MISIQSSGNFTINFQTFYGRINKTLHGFIISSSGHDDFSQWSLFQVVVTKVIAEN
jgi:hypothetical protein